MKLHLVVKILAIVLIQSLFVGCMGSGSGGGKGGFVGRPPPAVPTLPTTTNGSPGYAILSGGGPQIDVGLTVSTQTTLGEITSPATLAGASASLRTGLQGVLDP